MGSLEIDCESVFGSNGRKFLQNLKLYKNLGLIVKKHGKGLTIENRMPE